MFTQLCECIISSSLSVQQVLESISAHTICTNTQCFEDSEHAGFGDLHINSSNNIFFIILLFMMSYLLFVPRTMTTKHISIETNHNHIEEID